MIIEQNDNTRPSVFFALRTKIDCVVLPPTVEINTPSIDVAKCCQKGIDFLQVFADLEDAADYKNDKSSFLNHRYIAAQEAKYFLDTFDGAWTEVLELTVSTSEVEFYDWGFFKTDAEFKGIRVLWREILDNHGEGYYRIRTELTGLQTARYLSQIYCLRKFSIAESNGSARFDWFVNGNRSCVFNKSVRVDYGDINWAEQIRVSGMFGFETAERVETEIKYETGEQRDLRLVVTPNYLFKGGLNNYRTNETLCYNAFISNELYASDYCKLNDNPNYKMIAIKPVGGFSPEYLTYNLNNTVSVQFKDRFENTGFQLC